MNIHEHQAKNLLKEFGAPIPNGVVILEINELEEKIKLLKSKNFVVKAQIHAGGRGKAGCIKIVKSKNELHNECLKMFGKILITHQTGAGGKKVNRLYICFYRINNNVFEICTIMQSTLYSYKYIF